mmetsp:Transcript_28915/g.35748  ORF Transcript_28915/g.35748 Transcript_28915/m.35748 type:complete len:209 (+) Transcript_28915:12-638(+)
MLAKLNLANIAQLVALPLVYFLLKEYQLVQGFLFGLVSLSLFGEVQRYGVRAMVFKPGDDVVRQVFRLVEQGDLEALKALTKDIPPKNLVEMTNSARYTLLIYAVDCERREIVRWLIEEKGAKVNETSRDGTALQRAIFRNNELLVSDLLAHGANVDYRVPNMNINMAMFALLRDQARVLDMMLETGASMDYTVNGKPVDDTLKRKSP